GGRWSPTTRRQTQPAGAVLRPGRSTPLATSSTRSRSESDRRPSCERMFGTAPCRRETGTVPAIRLPGCRTLGKPEREEVRSDHIRGNASERRPCHLLLPWAASYCFRRARDAATVAAC